MKPFRSMSQLSRVQGFTLIELVMVIVILGILAAVALPRFYDLGSNARTASVQGVFGAMTGGVAVAHSVSLVNGTASAATSTVIVEGQTVNMVYGYPAASNTGILRAVNIPVGVGTNGAITTATTAGPPPTFTYQVSGGSSAATCSATYTEATSATVPASVSPPTLTGCQ